MQKNWVQKTKTMHFTVAGFACIAAANAAFWPAKIKVFKITLSKMTF